MSASHPSWSSPLYDAQACSTCRAVPSAIPRFCSPRRPCLPYACSPASNHTPVYVAAVTLRVQQPPQQAQERNFSSVPHLSPTSKSFRRLPDASSATAIHIQRELRLSPRLAPTYVHISSSGMTLTPTCNRGRALRIQRIHRLERFLLRIDSLRLDAQNPRYCGVSHAFGAHGYRLALDFFRIVAAVAIGGKAVETLAATIGLIAARESRFGQPVGAAAPSPSLHIVAIGSLH